MIFLIAALVVVAGYVMFRSKTPSNNFKSITELNRLCNGDAEQVKRLIKSEQKRNKNLDYNLAADAAIKSYKRDNR